jgi:hypothetical protein
LHLKFVCHICELVINNQQLLDQQMCPVVS